VHVYVSPIKPLAIYRGSNPVTGHQRRSTPAQSFVVQIRVGGTNHPKGWYWDPNPTTTKLLVWCTQMNTLSLVFKRSAVRAPQTRYCRSASLPSRVATISRLLEIIGLFYKRAT